MARSDMTMNGPPGAGQINDQRNDELAIEASGLVKAYRDVRVLSGVDLRVPRGSVFALLGPNGAGKTTTVRILATLTEADAGLARAAARRRAAELTEQFELTAAARRRVGTYSGGMRRRLDIAASLVGHPSVIFLDEPSTGLDPQSRLTMWRVIEGLAASGVTVFLTTQYLEEAERLAELIAVLDGGRVIAEGTAAELKRRVAAQRLDMTCANEAAFDQVSRHFGERAVHRDPASLTVGVPTDGSAAQGSAAQGSAAEVRALLDAADPGRVLIAGFAVHGATLDDVFLTLTGHPKEAAHV